LTGSPSLGSRVVAAFGIFLELSKFGKGFAPPVFAVVRVQGHISGRRPGPYDNHAPDRQSCRRVSHTVELQPITQQCRFARVWVAVNVQFGGQDTIFG
jgi:hypothetical protein